MSFNLRAGKNDPLRARVLAGTLPPNVLVSSSSKGGRNILIDC
ncbi:unnamed protein product [Laminaria digitata]